MKSSKDKQVWGHVTCVWYDPDAFFQDPTKMAPIVFRRPKPDLARKKPCSICRVPDGLCIQCRWPECKQRIHARCAQRSGGYLAMEPLFGGLLTEAYCETHREKRLDPLSLVRLAKHALRRTPLSAAINAIEKRLTGESPRYPALENFLKDMNPVLDSLASSQKSGSMSLAEDLRVRLGALKKGLMTG